MAPALTPLPTPPPLPPSLSPSAPLALRSNTATKKPSVPSSNASVRATHASSPGGSAPGSPRRAQPGSAVTSRKPRASASGRAAATTASFSRTCTLHKCVCVCVHVLNLGKPSFTPNAISIPGQPAQGTAGTANRPTSTGNSRYSK
eukprot:364898-Chlamydomonas_euryale.AAC.5